MGYKEQLSSFLLNWQSCISIVFAVFILYIFIYLIGSIVTFPFSKKLIEQRKIKVLLGKLLSGIIVFLLFVSIYYTSGVTINTIIIIPIIVIALNNYIKTTINISILKKCVQYDFKLFLLSFSIPFLILFVQFWKFDFFNSTTARVWCDYPYYSGIAKKMMIEHKESSYYTIPFSNTSIKFNFYHYSDIWICGGFEKLIFFVKGSDVYSYLYFTIAASIFLIGFISTLNFKKSKNRYFTFFLITCLIVLLLNEIFNVHNHKSFIPFACLIVFVKFFKAQKTKSALAILAIIPILNPLFLLVIPFALSFMIMSRRSEDILVLINNKKFICYSIGIAFASVLTVFLISNTAFFSLSAVIKDILKKETYELNYFKSTRLIGLILIMSLLFKAHIKIHKNVWLLFLNSLLLFFAAHLIVKLNYLTGFENWQLIISAKYLLYIVVAIVTSQILFNLFNTYSKNNFDKLICSILLILIVYQTFFKFYSSTITNTVFNYYFDKKVTTEANKIINSGNPVVGFYKFYKKEKEPFSDYVYQRASASEFISITEGIRKQPVWLTPVFIHNRLDSVNKIIQKNWRKSAIYNFKIKHHYNNESDLFNAYINAYKIKIVFTDLAQEKLPQYIKNKVKKYFPFHFNGKEYLMLII